MGAKSQPGAPHGVLEASLANAVLGAPADDIELALKVHVIRDPGITPHENLAHERLRRSGRRPQPAGVDGDRAPAQQVLPFLPDGLLEDPFALSFPARLFVRAQVNHSHAVCAGRGQQDADLSTSLLQEGVRHLKQNAGPVTGIGLAALGASMGQILENRQRLADNPV